MCIYVWQLPLSYPANSSFQHQMIGCRSDKEHINHSRELLRVSVQQCINPLLQTLVRRSFKHCPTTGKSPCMNMDIATVNALPYEDFVDILGNVVEKCPIITAAVWSGRPFLSLAVLEAAISEFIDALPESGETQT